MDQPVLLRLSVAKESNVNNKYCLVEFNDSKDVATVPESWILKDPFVACAWPGKHSCKFAKMNASVDKSWPRFSCQVLNTFDTYDAALKEERFLSSFTDLDQSEEQYRKPKRHKKNCSSSEDEVNSDTQFTVSTKSPGSSDGFALPDVSSSVNFDDATENGATQKVNYMDFNNRLEHLEKSCKIIQNDVREILELVRRNGRTVSFESMEMVENYLPLSSLASLYELESCLADNAERREEMRLHLQQLGGSSTDEMVKRILRHVFTDDLAKQFSWMGQKGKNKLSDLLLVKIIFHAVETSRMQASRERIEKRIREWFRQAATRNKHVFGRQLLGRTVYS